MPTAVTEVFAQPIPPDPPRKRWTRAECSVLESTGLFDQQRVELIDGELINKMGKNRPHIDTLMLVMAWLTGVFGARRANSEAPIDVAPEDNPTNEPQPDAIVLKQSFRSFRTAVPQPQDLEMVIEISDTSLTFDLTTKAALYARTGITDNWVLDVSRRRLIVHRQPIAGRYGSIVAYSENESVAPLAAPDRLFKVADVFPRDL